MDMTKYKQSILDLIDNKVEGIENIINQYYPDSPTFKDINDLARLLRYLVDSGVHFNTISNQNGTVVRTYVLNVTNKDKFQNSAACWVWKQTGCGRNQKWAE